MEMAKEVKEPASSKVTSSNRPFDIVNLTAPDKLPKKQTAVFEWKPAAPLYPRNFTIMQPVFPLNGNYTSWFLHIFGHFECMLENRRYVLRGLRVVEGKSKQRYLYHINSNSCSIVEIKIFIILFSNIDPNMGDTEQPSFTCISRKPSKSFSVAMCRSLKSNKMLEI